MNTHLQLWRPASRPMDLAGDEVHVWRAFLDLPTATVDRLADTLSDDEWERAHRYRCTRTRTQFLIARGVLRSLLGQYLGLSPREVRFRTGPTGKPLLDMGQPEASLHFNVSHTADLALLAFSRPAPVGVDVERLRPFPGDLNLAERYFSTNEFHQLRRLRDEKRTTAFFHCWTRKEALVKASGVGLAHGLERVEVSLHPDEPARIIRLDGVPDPNSWSLHHLSPAPGYVGALALESSAYRLVCWTWHDETQAHAADRGENPGHRRVAP